MDHMGKEWTPDSSADKGGPSQAAAMGKVLVTVSIIHSVSITANLSYTPRKQMCC